MVHDSQPTIYVGRSTGGDLFRRGSDSATLTPRSLGRDEWFGPADAAGRYVVGLPNKYDDSVQMLKLA